ncbi:hypothetical protein A0H81_02121 [Grifola frondosa]|uniref:Uncharacterized protein n=1 Tax=Grifola frondosa TaxID=5627 RepID=A0A1C7MPY2_GRIFR|nr:hypothetical protein A0H81_02121 [Grifola frondosa]
MLSGPTLPAELRIYSPRNDTPLPDNTIAFVVAKAHAPANGTILLDALSIYPFPGDPNSDDYQDAIPDMPYPFAYGLGSIQAKHEVLADGVSKGFMVDLSEHVRDSPKPSSVQCIYDGMTPHWLNVPTPNPNTNIHFLGVCSGLYGDGRLTINLENIVFNTGAAPPAIGGGGPPPAPGTPGAKRRKFNAFASSADANVSSPSSSQASSSSSLASSSSASETINSASETISSASEAINGIAQGTTSRTSIRIPARTSPAPSGAITRLQSSNDDSVINVSFEGSGDGHGVDLSVKAKGKRKASN